MSSTARRADATASTCRSTGKTRARASTSCGSRASMTAGGRDFRNWLKASTSGSIALYGTDSRS